ncbi:MAG: hypothetical protein GY904_34310 [Planctomycetaceae bacterium]|nr:hypothetical protein [Planctomycetaceae bacterium]
MRLPSLSQMTWMLLLSGGLATGLLAEEGTQETREPLSLGGLVRDTPPETQQFEWVRALEPQNADGADRRDAEAEAIAEAAEAEDAAVLRQKEIFREQISELQTPIDQIVVSSYLSDKPTPEDRAKEFLQTKPPIEIGGASMGAILPDRYPVIMYHRPLYFEQPNLERCGNTCGYFQNAISSALFFSDTVILPCRIWQHGKYPCVQAGGDCPTCREISRCQHKSRLSVNPASWAAKAAAGAGFKFLAL